MRKFLALFSMIAVLASCEKEFISVAEKEYIKGKIESLHDGSGEVNGFLVKLSNSNGESYDAALDNSFNKADFIVGKNVVFKGKLIDGHMEVKKVISKDSDAFVLNGTVQSTKDNEGGYSALILGVDDEEYTAEFSISNLGENYKSLNNGQEIKVSGNLWLINDKLQITVKSFIE